MKTVHMGRLSLTIAILLLTTMDLAAQTSQNAASPKPCTIEGSKHRQFDFWVGDWDVKVGGKQAGTNEVKLILGDCVVFENWTGAGGMNGKSFNFFNRNTGKWNQTWVDDRGGALEFQGELIDGAMRFRGETRDAKGALIMQKLSFFPLAEKQVRQLWESSTDDGKTWSTVFDGIYIRKSGK